MLVSFEEVTLADLEQISAAIVDGDKRLLFIGEGYVKEN